MYMYVMVRVLVEATTCRWVGMEGEDLGGGGGGRQVGWEIDVGLGVVRRSAVDWA